VHFGFDEQQVAVRDTVGSLLDKRCPVEAVQQAWADGHGGHLTGVWRELAGLGVQGLLAPESAGGSDLDPVTMALVLAETGRVALPLPIAETAAVAVPALVAAGDPDDLLGPLVTGDVMATLADGPGRLVSAASIADLFVVIGDDSAALYHRDQVDVVPEVSVDRTRDLGRVTPRPGQGGLDLAPAAVLRDLAALATAAQLIGLGHEMVRMTVEHVQQRHQFGVPIGSFQAVKHRLADAHLQMAFAAPAVWAAAQAIADHDPCAGRTVSLAKALASDAATGAGKAALQCHGAMGYTDEYRLHLWLKRTWCLAAAHGSAAWHQDRIGRELGL
jgi:alkylation response protein AidB-like acyl-CoA dehydrogenase